MKMPSAFTQKTTKNDLHSGINFCILHSDCNLESLNINKLRQNAECKAQNAKSSAFWKTSYKNNNLSQIQNVVQTPTPYGGSSEPHAHAGGSLPAFCNLTQSTSPLTQVTKDGAHE